MNSFAARKNAQDFESFVSSFKLPAKHDCLKRLRDLGQTVSDWWVNETLRLAARGHSDAETALPVLLLALNEHIFSKAQQATKKLSTKKTSTNNYQQIPIYLFPTQFQLSATEVITSMLSLGSLGWRSVLGVRATIIQFCSRVALFVLEP